MCCVKKRTARDGKNRAAKSENRGERKREFLNEEAAERATPIHIKKKKRE